MDMARINVPLARSEVVALVRMAESECRQPREQMRYLLREDACRRGLLSKEYQEQHKEEEQDGKAAVAGH